MTKTTSTADAPDYDASDGFTLYAGAQSCMRHRGEEFFELLKQGRLAYLILSEVDFITGDYLRKISEAAEEVTAEYHPAFLNIAAGCPETLLSTDFDMLRDELAAQLGIPVRVDRNCHLLGFDGHNRGNGHEERAAAGNRGGRHHAHGGSHREGGRHHHERSV